MPDIVQSINQQAADLHEHYRTCSLLSLTRELRDRERVYEQAMDAHENHRQAGFDVGYGDQFRREQDELSAAVDAARDHAGWFIERYIVPRIPDPDDRLRLYSIAHRYT